MMKRIPAWTLALAVGVGIGAVSGPAWNLVLPDPTRPSPPGAGLPADRLLVSTSDAAVTLPVRDVVQSNDPDTHDTEADWELVERPFRFEAGSAALVLIDVWAEHPNDGIEARMEPVTVGRIAPLLDAWRQAGLPVIHASHGHDIHPAAAPRDGELVLHDGDQQRFVRAIRKAGIDTLLYAGHASNMCIPHRPIGIENASRWVRNAVFVRDASTSVGGMHDPQLVHDMAIYQIELLWGSSTTTDDVIQALLPETRMASAAH